MSVPVSHMSHDDDQLERVVGVDHPLLDGVPLRLGGDVPGLAPCLRVLAQVPRHHDLDLGAVRAGPSARRNSRTQFVRVMQTTIALPASVAVRSRKWASRSAASASTRSLAPASGGEGRPAALLALQVVDLRVGRDLRQGRVDVGVR